MQPSPIPENKKRAFVQGSQEVIEFLFSLIAVYVIPALFLSSVILAASVTGYLDSGTPIGGALVWIGGIILTISIEAASIGSFNLAHQMQAHGHEQRAGWVRFMGIILTLLVIITLGFAAFHVTGFWDDVLKAVRVAAAVLYALAAHSRGHDELTGAQQDQIAVLFDQFSYEQLESLESRFNAKLQAEIERLTTRLRAFQSEQIESLVEKLTAHEDALSMLPMIERRLESLEASAQGQLRIVTEEVSRVKVTLEEAMPCWALVPTSKQYWTSCINARSTWLMRSWCSQRTTSPATMGLLAARAAQGQPRSGKTSQDPLQSTHGTPGGV